MTKKELIAKIAAEVDVSQAKAGAGLATVLDSIQYAIKGGGVTLVGFGTFKTVKREARKGRNPQTGKEIKIPAKKVVKFSVGKALKDAVK